MTGKTGKDGKVSLDKLRLGPSQLTVEKKAFAPIRKGMVVGWGSNPLGDFKLNAVGLQYSFVVTDFLSGQPMSKVEATYGEASALSDEKGEIVLVLDQNQAPDKDISVKLYLAASG